MRKKNAEAGAGCASPRSRKSPSHLKPAHRVLLTRGRISRRGWRSSKSLTRLCRNPRAHHHHTPTSGSAGPAHSPRTRGSSTPKAESGIPSSLGSKARPGRCCPAAGPPLAASAVQVNRYCPIPNPPPPSPPPPAAAASPRVSSQLQPPVNKGGRVSERKKEPFVKFRPDKHHILNVETETGVQNKSRKEQLPRTSYSQPINYPQLTTPSSNTTTRPTQPLTQAPN